MDRMHMMSLTERSSKYFFEFFPLLETAQKLERTKIVVLELNVF